MTPQPVPPTTLARHLRLQHLQQAIDNLTRQGYAVIQRDDFTAVLVLRIIGTFTTRQRVIHLAVDPYGLVHHTEQ